MVALLTGLILLLFAVYSVLPVPWSLQWGQYAIDFLKGGAPILSLLVGVIALFIGIADIRDRIEAKKEEDEEKKEG